MAAIQTDETPAVTCLIPRKNPDSGNDPLSATAAGGDNPNKKDPETVREPKRRKICPSALNNLEAIDPSSNSSFSFTFDAESAATPEVTPKFGSFKLVASPAEIDGCCQIPATEEKDGEEEEEEEEESQGSEGRTDVVGFLNSVDGIRTGD